MKFITKNLFNFQDFFNILHHRFSIEENKIRLPNKVQKIPYGTKNLTMYTWSFYDLESLQQIFSTKNVSYTYVH